MKDVVDEMLEDLARNRDKREFLPLPDLGDGTAETLGVKLAKVLRKTTLSQDAVLSTDEVIEAIGGRAPVVRKWLRESVLPLRHPSGRTVYRWGDVLHVLRRAA